jgi:hypothetical protein
MARTETNERIAAFLLEQPLLSESVYHSPRYRLNDKEVTDILLVHRNRALVIEIKCQDEPDTRVGWNLEAWANKAASKAAKQLAGCIRTMQ